MIINVIWDIFRYYFTSLVGKISYVDHPCCITLFEVIQHRGFIEMGHHGHVLNFVILGRIHGCDIIVLDCPLLKTAQKKVKFGKRGKENSLWQ